MSNVCVLVITFVMFILVSILWYQLAGMSPEEGMVFTAVFVMLGEFVCGVFLDTYKIYWLMAVCSFLGILTLVFNISFVKSGNDKLLFRVRDFFSPSVIIMFVVFGYCVIAFRGALFTYPDEYYQWGASLKYMHESRSLPYGIEFLGEDITFSSATFFQYYFVGLGEFIEKNGFVGNFILAFLPTLLPFSNYKWEKWKQIFVYSIIIFLSFNLLTYVKYYNLLQDFVLPMWAGGIVAWVLWNKKSKWNWLFVYGIVACIASMKSLVGPMFALVVIIVIIVKQIINIKVTNLKDVLNFRVLINFVCILVSFFGINVAWSNIVSESVFNRSIAAVINNKDLSLISKGIINKIFTIFSSSTYAVPYFSYMMFFGGIIVFVLWQWNRHENIREKIVFNIVYILYTVGFFFFIAVMYYAYWNVFGEADSTIVAGLERYLSYYMMIGVVPVVSHLFVMPKEVDNKSKRVIQVVLFLLCIYSTGNDFVTKCSTLNKSNDSQYISRQTIKEQADIIKELTEDQGKILLVGNMSASDSKMLMYELGNRYIWNEDCYQIYTRSKSDAITYVDVLTYPKLIEILKYDYVWFYNAEEVEKSFTNLEHVYEMISIKDGQLYKVNCSENRHHLEYLGNTLDVG